jgi:hypothetical protein
VPNFAAVRDKVQAVTQLREWLGSMSGVYLIIVNSVLLNKNISLSDKNTLHFLLKMTWAKVIIIFK